MSSGDKLLASAIQRLEMFRRQEAFDPFNLDSRPTEKQLAVLREFGTIPQQYIRAGNQCLVEGTLVRTPLGNTPIEKLQVGDTVYNEHGSPIRVKQVFSNGVKQVVEIIDSTNGSLLAEATLAHTWLTEVGQFTTNNLMDKKLIAFEGKSILPILGSKRLAPTYDIHVESPTNLYLLANGLVTHNSGKSQTCARIVSWVIEESHPYWKRRSEWGEEPLLVVIAGRTSKQLEESLLPKLESYLQPNSYKLIRIGNVIQRLEHTNGNRIVFQSLENSSVAQQRLQSYTAHLAWLDEMPPTLGILRELLIRVQARNGFFLASFTPTVVNAEIQKFIDSIQEPDGRLYRFNMLDNPLYNDATRKEQLLSRYSMLPEHVQKAIFEGEWLSGDNLVYYFNWATMVRPLPDTYSPSQWRHLVSVDPATQSKLGLTVWAEDMVSGLWYCVSSEYIQGVYVPTEIVAAVESRIRNYNVVRRVSDSEASWFINQASNMGYSYIPTYKKANRKQDLIKQYQQALGTRIFLTPECNNLIDEMQSCRWADTGEGKIINGSKYHTIDTAHYAVDNLPKWEGKQLPSSHHEWLWKQHLKRKETEEAIARKNERRSGRMRIVRRRAR